MIILFWVALIAAGVAVALAFQEWIPVIVILVVIVVAAIWVLVSTLSPAVPNRECPHCREQGLVKIRRGEPGVRCELCGFVDEDMHVAYLDEW